jgi:hypothetical protein
LVPLSFNSPFQIARAVIAIPPLTCHSFRSIFR